MPVIPATWEAELENRLNPGGRCHCTEPRSHHCTPPWAKEWDFISKKNKTRLSHFKWFSPCLSFKFPPVFFFFLQQSSEIFPLIILLFSNIETLYSPGISYVSLLWHLTLSVHMCNISLWGLFLYLCCHSQHTLVAQIYSKIMSNRYDIKNFDWKKSETQTPTRTIGWMVPVESFQLG